VRHDVKWITKVNEPDPIIEEAANKVTGESVPNTIREALSSPERKKWLEAIKKELNALFELGTLRILDRVKNSIQDAIKVRV
jgi:hypothetical protein